MVDSLRDVLKAFDQASKYTQIPLPKPKNDVGSTKIKDNLFIHHHKNIFEHSDGQIPSSFRFGNNKPCVFSIKKFEIGGSQITLTEIVKRNRRQIHHLQENRQKVAKKCETIERTYDV